MLTVDANVWISAFDPRDPFHAQSLTFLAAAANDGLTLVGPGFVVVETGCAVARRLHDAQAGARTMERLRMNPLLSLLPLNERLLVLAGELGVRNRVRGADALYVAAAVLSGAPLVSWDQELVNRAGAVTPTDWLSASRS